MTQHVILTYLLTISCSFIYAQLENVVYFEPDSFTLSSHAANFTPFQDKVYFSTKDLSRRRAALWYTDGTSAGTKAVYHDFWDIFEMAALDDKLIFSATDQQSYRIPPVLWVSDGTQAGTGRISFPNTAISTPRYFTLFKDKIFFSQSGIEGHELWVTDGTDAGTYIVKDIDSFRSGLPQKLFVFNEMLYFSATTIDEGRELWVSDGTEAGTVLFKDIFPGTAGSSPSNFIVFKEELYFTVQLLSQAELWKTDGTAAGTTKVLRLKNPFSNEPQVGIHLAVFRDSLYVTEVGGNPNIGLYWPVLKRTDGTEAGTSIVHEITDFPVSYYLFSHLKVSNESLVLFARPANSFNNFTVFVSDGREQISKIAENQRTFRFPYDFALLNGQLYFLFDNKLGTIQDTSFILFEDFSAYNQDVSAARYLLAHENNLYFSASTPGYYLDIEPWISDGTNEGSHLLKEINGTPSYKGSLDYQIVSQTPEQLFFLAYTPETGVELWVSDLNRQATYLIQDLTSDELVNHAGSYLFGQFQFYDGYLYFNSIDERELSEGGYGFGRRMWRTDGTAAQMEALDWPFEVAHTRGDLSNKVVFKDRLYMGAFPFTGGFFGSPELWSTDGTEAAMTQISNIAPSRGSFPAELFPVEDQLYFSASSDDLERRLWVTDGTADGTQMVSDLQIPDVAFGNSFNDFIALGDRLFFSTSSPEKGLWVTKGTEGTTELVKAFLGGSAAYFYGANSSNIFFNKSSRLWVSNGTESGTLELGAFSYSVSWGGVFLGENWIFAARSGGSSSELWLSNGTADSTFMIKDLRPGLQESYPRFFVKKDSLVYFVARDIDFRDKIWQTDGTAEGTKVVDEFEAFDRPITPYHLTVWNEQLYFMAVDSLRGMGLFRLRSIPTKIDEGIGRGNSLRIFPNPTQTRMTIQLEKPLLQTGTLEVWDINGKKHHEWTMAAGTSEIAVSSSTLIPGVYILQLKSKGINISNKFIVRP